MMRLVLTLLILISASFPARADAEATYAAIVARTIDDVIRPGYEQLAREAAATETVIADLCAAPTVESRDAARTSFARLVDAWSRIELIRFGPVRSKNRHERLNFWPDRKGRGLLQVQQIIAQKDESAVAVATLRQKSVAVQGLGALEFVLFGDGADSLTAAHEDGAYRCAYGHAIAGAIRATAEDIIADWRPGERFVAVLTRPGPDNPAYRDHGEVIQELLRAMTEELQLVRDIKIGALLGDSPEQARPRRAPFYRSGLTMAVAKANLEAVYQLFEKGDFLSALPSDDAWLLQSIRFELDQAVRNLEAAGPDLAAALRDEDKRRLIALAIISINGTGETIGDYYTERTGLAIGFNSLDGD